MVEIKVRQTEIQSVVSNGIDSSIFRKHSNSKTFQGWLISRIKEARDRENKEMVILLSEIYQKYRSFAEYFSTKSWRGKDKVYFIEKPDLIIAVTHQREDIGEKPKEVKTEILRKEINEVEATIHRLNIGNLIKTSEIAEENFHRAWKSVFSDRPTHIKLVLILNFLEYKKKIHYYRSGKIKVLENGNNN